MTVIKTDGNSWTGQALRYGKRITFTIPRRIVHDRALRPGMYVKMEARGIAWDTRCVNFGGNAFTGSLSVPVPESVIGQLGLVPGDELSITLSKVYRYDDVAAA